MLGSRRRRPVPASVVALLLVTLLLGVTVVIVRWHGGAAPPAGPDAERTDGPLHSRSSVGSGTFGYKDFPHRIFLLIPMLENRADEPAHIESAELVLARDLHMLKASLTTADVAYRDQKPTIGAWEEYPAMAKQSPWREAWGDLAPIGGPGPAPVLPARAIRLIIAEILPNDGFETAMAAGMVVRYRVGDTRYRIDVDMPVALCRDMDDTPACKAAMEQSTHLQP